MADELQKLIADLDSDQRPTWNGVKALAALRELRRFVADEKPGLLAEEFKDLVEAVNIAIREAAKEAAT